MKVLAIVPARCGSKGFPNKNIAKIGDQTLLELAVKVGLECNLIDDVYVSTDSSEYERIALSVGAKSLGLRSKYLSSDTAKSVDVVIDLLDKLDMKYDYVILLQPTSPVRTASDISNMLNIIDNKHVDACVSVCKIEEPHPYKLKSVDSDGYIKPFISGTSSEVTRQSLPPVYALNGAIYISKVSSVRKYRTLLPGKVTPYIMDSLINIDNKNDLICYKAMLEQKNMGV